MGTELTLTEKSGLPAIKSNEVVIASGEAAAIQEIQGAIIIAKKFPRNELDARQALKDMCKDLDMANAASYEFPRGSSMISGPSVHLARAAAQVWGNIRYGVDILRDDGDEIQLRGWAWDVQTNTKSNSDDSFKCLIQRKQKSGKTEWVKPDERDRRELVNRHGAFLERNCLLKLIPRNMINAALDVANATLANGVKGDAKRFEKTVEAFAELGVKASQLEEYLGKSIKAASDKEIMELRKIYVSIRDGYSRWAEYIEQPAKTEATTASMDDLMNPKDGTTEDDRRMREKSNKETTAKQGKASKPVEIKGSVSAQNRGMTVQGGAGADDMFPGADGEDAPPIEELQAKVVAMIGAKSVKGAIVRKQVARYEIDIPEDLVADDLARHVAAGLNYQQLNEYISLLERIK